QCQETPPLSVFAGSVDLWKRDRFRRTEHSARGLADHVVSTCRSASGDVQGHVGRRATRRDGHLAATGSRARKATGHIAVGLQEEPSAGGRDGIESITRYCDGASTRGVGDVRDATALVGWWRCGGGNRLDAYEPANDLAHQVEADMKMNEGVWCDYRAHEFLRPNDNGLRPRWSGKRSRNINGHDHIVPDIPFLEEFF